MEDIVTFQGNIDTLAGRAVFGADGHRIGTVGQVFVMQGTEQPTWVTVQTGLFGTHESFVPMAEATERGDELVVPYDKAFVKDAPRIDEASELTVEQEGELYRYYGVQPPMQHGQQSGGEADAVGQADAVGHHDPARDDAALHTGVVPDAGRHEAGHESHHRLGAAAGGAAAGGAAGAALPGTGQDGSVGGPRLRRRIVTEMQTVQVPVQREEIYVEGDELPPQAGEGDRRS
jgi:sporulation protein YlmC with PRC-barrel domain